MSLIEAEFIGQGQGRFRPASVQDDNDIYDEEFEDEAASMQVNRDPRTSGPKIKRRTFTDGVCLMTFALYMLVLAWILKFARDNGDIEKLTHGYDWKGQICGFTEDVIEKPYIYWCAKKDAVNPTDPTGPKIPWQLSDPICVSECPNGTATSFCPGQVVISAPITSTNSEGVQVTSRTVTRTEEWLPDIASKEAMYYYCLPENTPAVLEEIFGNGAMKNGFKTATLFLDAIDDGKWFLVLFGFMAILLGYAYLFILRTIIEPIIYATFALTDLSLLLLAGYFYVIHNPDFPGLGKFVKSNDFVTPVFGEANSKTISLYASIVSFILFVVFSIYFALANRAIQRTAKAVAGSFEALARMPTLLLGPVVQIFAQMFCFVCMITGLFVVLSLGEVKTHDSYVSALSGSTEHVEGVYRELTFTNSEWVMLWIWGFGFLWTFEMCKAWNQFAISHAIVMLECLNVTPSLPLLRGYFRGAQYHLGTIAFGAFIMGIVDLFSFLIEVLSKQMRTENGKLNKVAEGAKCICRCCCACVKAILSVTNQLVYADCVIYGHSYLKAAKNVMGTYLSDGITMATVMGTTKLVKTAGIFVISVGGTLLSYTVMKVYNGAFNESMGGIESPGITDFASNYSSPYAASVLGVTAASMFISISVAQSFMTTFDMITDTIAYCDIRMDKMKGSGYALLT